MPPAEWIIARVCEEFAIDPLRAVWVIDHAPLGLVEEILALRAYANTYQALQDAHSDTKTQRRLYDTPAGQLVAEIELRIAQRRRGTET